MNDTTGRITAGSFVGDGSAMTGINSDSGSWVNGTDVVHLATTGDKVGIGTTSPSTLLHIQSKTSDPLVTEGDGIGAHNLTEYLRFTGLGDGGDVNNVSIGFKLGADDNSVISPDGRLDICVNDGAHGNNGYGAIPDKTIATFLGSGNVGIGTTSPGAKLDVNGGVILTGGTHGSRPTNDGGVLANAEIRGGPGVGSAGFLRLAAGGYNNGSASDATSKSFIDLCGYSSTSDFDRNISFHTLNQERMRINLSGNVGIGTTSPGHPLDVQFTGDSGIRSKNTGSSHASVYIDSGSGYSYLRFESGGAAKFWLQSTPTGDLAFRPSGGGHVMDILNNGNVGIGTSSPGAKLHVNGGELRVTNADTAVARIALYGSSQGTGQVFVGQSAQYGGGIEYNGDNSPTSTGAGADYITLYRVNNNTYDWTARNSYASNNWEFRGNVKTPLLDMNGTTMSKAPRVIHIDDSRSGCPPTQVANTSIMEHSLALARSAYVFVSVSTILVHTARADCQIFFGTSLQQNHLTASDNTSWNPVCMTAGGTIGAGTTIIKFSCSTANVVGCQSDWGGMQILVFEQ